MLDLMEVIKKKLVTNNISHPKDSILKLNNFMNLLDKWNKAYNLTAVRDINEMLEKHLMDSLSISTFLKGKNFIDVGSGAGFPGIPLAIMFPEIFFVLLDSNGKKTRFLNQVKNELALSNVEVVYKRAEMYQPKVLFDGVLTRAFSSLEDMLKTTDHLCKENGKFYAMKGEIPEAELRNIDYPYIIESIDWVENIASRHLIVISKKM